MVPGLVVLACGVVRAGELEADPREVRADGEDGFVLFCGLARLVQAHVDRAQEEAPLDRLLLVGGFGLLQEHQRMLEAPGLHEQPGGREVRYLRPGGRRLLGCPSGLRQRPDGDQGRQGACGNEARDSGNLHAPHSRPARGLTFPLTLVRQRHLPRSLLPRLASWHRIPRRCTRRA